MGSTQERLTPTARVLIDQLRKLRRREVDLVRDDAMLKKITPRPRWLLSDMHKRGIAHPVQWGRYVVNIDGASSPIASIYSLDPLASVLLARLDEPYYLSWHSALWHHGLLEQQSNRLRVAVTFRKRDAHFETFDIQFVTVRPRKFFGWADAKSERPPAFLKHLSTSIASIPVATVEKALIDSFDRPELAAPLSLVAAGLRTAWRSKRLDAERLVADAIRFDSPTVNRRLGFFMDLFEIPGSAPLALRLGRNHVIPLEPGAAPRGKTNHRWLVFADPVVVNTALAPK